MGLNPYQDLHKPKQGFAFNNPIFIKPKQGFAFNNPIVIEICTLAMAQPFACKGLSRFFCYRMKASIATKEFVYQPRHNHSSFEFDEEEEKVEEKHVCEVYQVGVCRGVAGLDLEKERCREQR